MGSLARHAVEVFRRLAQCAADPLAVTLPGWGAMMRAVGLSGPRSMERSPSRLAAGLVLVLPGIEGPSLYTRGLCVGLLAGGVASAIEVVNWAGAWPGTLFAFRPAAARRRAERVLARVSAYRSAWPGRPAVLVGHSGGAAVAVFAAEAAGTDRALDGVALLATPLSPAYDLTAAAGGCHSRLWAFHSRLDLQLRVLTGVGGNFDRRFGRTGGREGFAAMPPGAVQLGWDRSMIADGHWGGHVGCTVPRWVSRHLAGVVAAWVNTSQGGPT